MTLRETLHQFADVAPALGVIVALLALVIEGKRSRRAHGVENALRMLERFESPVMKSQRKRAAEFIKIGMPDEDVEGVSALTEIFDFFGVLGVMVAEKSVSRTMALHFFGSSFFDYYGCAAPFLARMLLRHNEYWPYLYTLRRQLQIAQVFSLLPYLLTRNPRAKGRSRHVGSLPKKVNSEHRARFLRDESSL